MTEVRYAESIVIAAPIEKVYRYRLEFANLPAYNPNVSNLRRTDGGDEPGPGAEYAFLLTIAGMGSIETPLRVIAAERPSRIVIETGPGYMAREVSTFGDDGGSTQVAFETTVSFDGELDDGTRAAIEASGREQARLELEMMKKALEG